MLEITIDADVCQKDGACAMACTRDVFRQEETGTMPKIVGLERCFGCGQVDPNVYSSKGQLIGT